MPIVDALVVLPENTALPPTTARALADALSPVLKASPGTLWVRLQALPAGQYAENGVENSAMPIFLSVLLANAAPTIERAVQAAALAAAASRVLGRDVEFVHVEYATPGRGRVAFGGKLLQ